MSPPPAVPGSLNANAVMNPPLAAGLVLVNMTVIVAVVAVLLVTPMDPVKLPRPLSLAPLFEVMSPASDDVAAPARRARRARCVVNIRLPWPDVIQ